MKLAVAPDFQRLEELIVKLRVIPPDISRTGRDAPASISHVFTNLSGAISIPIGDGLVKRCLHTIEGISDRMATLQNTFAPEIAKIGLEETPLDVLNDMQEKLMAFLPSTDAADFHL
jgi:hypothetical protein